MRARLEALAEATRSLVLFVEYVPQPLLGCTWTGTSTTSVPTATASTWSTGLATSTRFDLSDSERRFAAHHTHHDEMYAAMRPVNWLATTVCGVPVPANGGPAARNEFVRRCAAGDIPPGVPAAVSGILARHAPAAARMNDFYWRLFDGDLHIRFPGA